MSAVSGLLGMGGGANGTGFNVQTPFSNVQIGQANQGVQGSLNNQAGFVQATQPGGTAALQSQQDLLTQLSQRAQGQGPNPALAQLNQTTGQNVAAQNALMAGQRGASQNVGLMARQAAQQGATTQQNAVGQAATMSAQQQIAAQQQLQAQQAQMVGQQSGAIGQQIQGQLGNQGQMIGGIGAQNQTQAELARTTMTGQQNMIGGLAGAAGSAIGLMGAEGGMVPTRQQMASGGQVMMAGGGDPLNTASYATLNPMGQNSAGPQSNVGKYMSSTGGAGANGASPGGQTPQDQANAAMKSGFNSLGSGIGKAVKGLFNNSSSPMQSDEATQSDYLSADQQLGAAGTDNPDVELSASNDASGLGGSGGMSDMDPYGLGGSSQGSGSFLAPDAYGPAADASLEGEFDAAGGADAGAGGGDLLSGIGSDLSGLWSGLGSDLSGLWGGISDAASGAGAAIGEGASDVGGAIAGGAADVGAGVAAAAPEAAEAAPVLLASRGGKVPALVSPGEQYLKPKDVKKALHGKNPMKLGEKIPGKPKVTGAVNSYANDTVKKNLDEGGIVIPRSVTEGKNPHWEAMKFVHATIAKTKHGKK